jgi:hypothetical protein
MSCIEDAIKKGSESWQPIQEEGDYNPVDVFYTANMLETYCKLNLGVPSTDLSKRDMAQTLVELVQEELHPHTDVFRSRDL